MNPHDVKAALQEVLRGNTHITITAPTGGGKSYFVGLLLEQAYAARKPWIVLDTSDRNHIGLIQLKEVIPLKIRKTENPDYSKLVNYPFILCYPDDEMEIDDLIEEYRKIIQALLRAQKPRIICGFCAETEKTVGNRRKRKKSFIGFIFQCFLWFSVPKLGFYFIRRARRAQKRKEIAELIFFFLTFVLVKNRKQTITT